MVKSQTTNLKDLKNAENRVRYKTDPTYADSHKKAARLYHHNNKENLNKSTTEYLQDPVHRQAHNDRRKLQRRRKKLTELSFAIKEIEEAMKIILNIGDRSLYRQLCLKYEDISCMIRQTQREIKELECIDGRTYEARKKNGRSR